MAKVMLVEDDNNLREIYEARLLAEGYEIVSAQDGEEALALAVKERPDLIIADIMMPKISGFDMLDILRSTPETKDTKVIMMTALSQAEDKERANKLGADRYLVKSQVTLEDVARVAHEVLEGEASPTNSGTGANQAVSTPSSASEPPAAALTDIPVATDPAASTPIDAPVANSSIAQDEAAIAQKLDSPTNDQPNTQTPISSPTTANPTILIPSAPVPVSTTTEDNDGVLAAAVASVNGTDQPTKSDPIGKHSVAVASDDKDADNAPAQTAVHDKVITPINDLNKQATSFQELVAKEEAKENAVKAASGSPVTEHASHDDAQADSSTSNTLKPSQSSDDPGAIAL